MYYRATRQIYLSRLLLYRLTHFFVSDNSLTCRHIFPQGVSIYYRGTRQIYLARGNNHIIDVMHSKNLTYEFHCKAFFRFSEKCYQILGRNIGRQRGVLGVLPPTAPSLFGTELESFCRPSGSGRSAY